MKLVLMVDGLRKRFGDILAVDEVNFEVQAGEIFGILGPNGAGKSTILAMVTGLVKADAGNIELFGFGLEKSYRQAVKNLGVLVENPGFYDRLSALHNLRLFSRFKEFSPCEMHHVLEKVGLEAYANKKVRTFSQGMRKRLGLANALLGHPKLLVLDEPTNGLDPRGAVIALELIKSLTAEKKISVVISSNLLYDMEAVCDRVLLIDKGGVVFCKSVQELLKPGEDSYTIRVEPLEKALLLLRTLPGIRSADRVDTGSLRVVLSGLSVAALNRQLVGQGFDVTELIPIKKTLQELFLQIKA